MESKIFVVLSTLCYFVLILLYPSDASIQACIPLFSSLITILMSVSLEGRFSFNVCLEKIASKMRIRIRIQNTTKHTYNIRKVKIGDLPEKILAEEINPLTKIESINVDIFGTLPSNLKTVDVMLYVNIDTSNKCKRYSMKKILNPYYEITK